MDDYIPPHGYKLSEPRPDYQPMPTPYDRHAAAYLDDDPYDLYNWQAIEPSSSRGARSPGFGAGATARLSDQPGSFHGYGAIGATSYEPESLYGDRANGATSYAPRQSRSREIYEDYGHGNYNHDGRHHGGSYKSDAHGKPSHKEGKRRAYDTSISQRPHHHDSGRSVGHRGNDYFDQVLQDQMLAMSLQHQEDEYSLPTVVEEPHYHHGRDHHSSREYSEDPRSRAHPYEYDQQSTSSFAHQGHSGRRRGHGDVSDSYLDRYETISPKLRDYHRGGSRSSSRRAACGVCFDEFSVDHLYELCPGVKCPLYCASCTKRWFKSTTKTMPKQPVMCCKESVPIDLVFAHLFRPQFVEEYMTMKMEFDTEDKIYCSYKKCSAFIPPPSIKGKNATCQECGRQTCTRCKNASHRGDPCRSNPEDEKVKRLGHRKGWQQCPGCSNLVERVDGCLHIKFTICATDWCYNCGRKDCDTERCLEHDYYPFYD